ncbi:HelD family protein [Ruania halotolerans]|uniref:HelD family protein n=1 Tax=Ruania halotolerans TaxID=2897773 RepID=UPI001E3903D9|nr:UvrD-helicase domain-containing protein [Ruania halotolerans]UFU06419.1 AAA family ATPase [Ruania halotolerans]
MQQEIEFEQAYLDLLYRRVEALRAEIAGHLDRARRADADGPTDLLDRDAQVARLEERANALDHAEHALCFGRLDRRESGATYIGRMGLRSADLETLLVDWRAPAAADFYTATARSGSDVVRRRHLRTRGRTVVGLNDELLDGSATDSADTFVGEAALMEALTAERTGRMHEIVSTLQAEQDEIIRSPAEGVLVVQGGPGTGKTAVALHRTAYLLYTHATITERGVLVLGPTGAFLEYIHDVLPSLGETHAVLATADSLVPGMQATRGEHAETAAVKALPVMAQVMAAAVRARQGGHDGSGVTFTYQGDDYRLTAAVIAQAVERAQHSGYPHNVARRTFRTELIDHIVELVLTREHQLYDSTDTGFEEELGRLDRALAKGEDHLPAKVEGGGTEVTGLAGEHEAPRVRRELMADATVTQVLENLWPHLNPANLLEELLSDRDRLARAATDLLQPSQLDALIRRPAEGWASGDIPLLDELAELVGEDDADRDAAAQARREAGIRYAQRVIAASGNTGAVSAEDLAERFTERDGRPLAERAAADRSWAYGHVIVDEAQELTAMQWRMVLRRVPSGSMTVVGDIHQTAAVAGTTSWEALADAHAHRKWRHTELTVSYRTLAPIMDAALPVLHALDATATTPVCARRDGERPWLRTAHGDLVGEVGAAVVSERDALGGGTFAVIAPPERLVEIAMAVEMAVPGASFGAEVDTTAPCVVLTPQQAKGLEFDGVLVVDPGTILAGRRGHSGLYVAMTRPTRRLGLLVDGDIPEVLRHLAPG